MSRKINVVGDKIANARLLLGKQWTQDKLAEELSAAGLEVSRQQIVNWELGRTRGMPMAVLTVMAQILRKPLSYFSADTVTLQEEKGRIPIVGVVNARNFNFSYDMPSEADLPLKLDLKDDRRAVALRVSGDCMVNPKDPKGSLYDGDYVVIVEPKNKQCPNGKIAVIRLAGDEYTLKRVFKTEDGYELKPDNDKYESIFIKGDIDVVGIKLAKWSP